MPVTDFAIYGTWAGLAIWFCIEKLWPLLAAWLNPERTAKRQAAQRKADEEKAEQEARWQQQLFRAFENNTGALVGLQHTLSHMSAQLISMSTGLHELNEDVAGIYGHIQQPRPSRKQKPVREHPDGS